jgi:uncharacterized protein YecT (DUF1311 family)
MLRRLPGAGRGRPSRSVELGAARGSDVACASVRQCPRKGRAGRPGRSSIGLVRFALMTSLAGAAALSSVAVAGNSSPVIREPWTPLPCPAHPNSTVEIEGCLERAVLRSDRRIDAKAATIVSLLRHQSDRAAFVEGEQAWLRYRRRSCSATASVYRGGSAEPVAFLRCEQNRNTRHLTDLLDTERTLHHG